MIAGVGGGSDSVEQTRVAALGRPQDVKRAQLDERQRTQTFGLAQCEPERDAAIVGMTDEMEWCTVRAGFANGCLLLGKAQRAGAVRSSGTGWKPTNCSARPFHCRAELAELGTRTTRSTGCGAAMVGLLLSHADACSAPSRCRRRSSWQCELLFGRRIGIILEFEKAEPELGT